MEAQPVTRGSPGADGLRLTLLAAALVPFSAWLTHAGGFGLHFDEAQYWTWSRHLDWSYYSKGPLVAWLIAASTAAFGHGVWQVRLFAWLAHGALLILTFAFARDVWQDRRCAWWAVLLVLTTPMFFTLGMVMTTDVFLFLFWTWGLWAAYRALCRGRRSAWYELGAAVGLGALTKLSIGLLPLFVGLLVLSTRAWHRHLKDPNLWLALLLMLALMSPLVGWNATHNWVMFRHEMGHIEATTWSGSRVLRFVTGQLFGLSPLIAALMAASLYRPPAAAGLRFLWTVSVMGIVFFTVKAVSAKVQMNWPAPVYIGLFVVFAGDAVRFTGVRRRLLWAGVAVSVILTAVSYFPATVGLPGNRDPFKETKYWPGSVQRLYRELAGRRPDFILAPNYKLASELAFYWPGRLPVYLTGGTGRRHNQFDLWPGVNREAGRTGLYVSGINGVPPRLDRAFAGCTVLPPVQVRAYDGAVVRTLYARLCRDYRPVQWPPPTTY